MTRLYRQGEYVAAGNPVVVPLPPTNIKVRFFVPQEDFAEGQNWRDRSLCMC